jgi:8-oxo-dGTP pyrophosphatase MutT (NUDIX family)
MRIRENLEQKDNVVCLVLRLWGLAQVALIGVIHFRRSRVPSPPFQQRVGCGTSDDMNYPFDDRYRREVAALCASFVRLPEGEAHRPLKRAAVAIALVEAEVDAGEAAFLLTRRTDKLRAHGGQWALPGGRCDAGETVAQAALRELEEEVGLRLGADAVLGLLDDYPTRSGYLITPVVVWAGRGAALQPNPDEVASVHRIPLKDITPEHVVSFASIPESDRPIVRILINGNHVNAPTAAMIYQFREMLVGRLTRVAEFEQPVFAWR